MAAVDPQGDPAYKARCTKEKPWDKKTLPVLHVDGDFLDDLEILHCPNCDHYWSLGPDL
jgi:hypothetical protein